MTPTHASVTRPKKLTTDRSVASLKPRADRYIVRDAKVSGLELRVSPDKSKTWTLRYRIRGQQRRLKLGAYPTAHARGCP